MQEQSAIFWLGGAADESHEGAAAGLLTSVDKQIFSETEQKDFGFWLGRTSD